jgi:hypothetical protein
MTIASRRATKLARAALGWTPAFLLVLLTWCGGGGPLAAQPLRWAQVGPHGGWVQSLAPVPASAGTVWAGIPGAGVWRSVDGGESWVRSALAAPTGGVNPVVAADPVDPLIVYAGTTGGLVRSVDGGASWNPLPGTGSLAAFAVGAAGAAAPPAPRVIYQASAEVLPMPSIMRRSDDGGATWRIISPGLSGITAIVVDPTDARTVYVTGSYFHVDASPGFLRSSDGGATWTSLPVGDFVSSLAIDPRVPATLYAAGDRHGILRSRDRGTTWEVVRGGLPDLVQVDALALDPASGALYAVLEQFGFLIDTWQIWKSVDGAGSWTQVLSGLDRIQTVAVDAGLPGRVYAGTVGSGALVSADAGARWQLSSAGMDAIGVEDLEADPHAAGSFYVVERSIARIERTTDAGATWTPASPGPAGAVTRVAADPQTPGLLYAAADAHVWKSADSGRTWQDLGPSPLFRVLDVAVDPLHPGVVLAAGIGATNPYTASVARSVDRGATWQLVLSIAPASGNTSFESAGFKSFVVDPGGFIYAGGEPGVWISADGGATWSSVRDGLPFGRTVTRLSLDHDRRAYAMVEPAQQAPGTGGGLVSHTLFRRLGGGTAFEPFDDGLPATVPVRDLVQDPRGSALYAATDAGVYVQFLGSIHWAGAQNDGLSDPRVTRLAADPLHPGTLYAGTASGVFVSPAPAGSCAPDDTMLCLAGGRFSVRVSWRLRDGTFGDGHGVALTGDTGTFWFFGPASTELTVKVLDGTAVNGHFWVFHGGLSDVEYVLEVTDVATGARRTYSNPAGRLASGADTEAFASAGGAGAAFASRVPSAADTEAFASSDGPEAEAGAAFASRVRPAAGAEAAGRAVQVSVQVSVGGDATPAASCVPARGLLCLLGSRFAVAVRWRFPGGGDSPALTVPLSQDTGAFWFFGPHSLEVLVKMIDGRPVNGHFWVFVSGLSDVGYTVDVTDVVSGAHQEYVNRQGELRSLADTAF